MMEGLPVVLVWLWVAFIFPLFWEGEVGSRVIIDLNSPSPVAEM